MSPAPISVNGISTGEPGDQTPDTDPLTTINDPNVDDGMSSADTPAPTTAIPMNGIPGGSPDSSSSDSKSTLPEIHEQGSLSSSATSSTT